MDIQLSIDICFFGNRSQMKKNDFNMKDYQAYMHMS